MSRHRGKLSSKAALNNIIIKSQPYYYFGGAGDIIPYGQDNLYPQRIEQAMQDSSTAQGCLDRLKYFIKGQGFALGGDYSVNRDGETLNDLLALCVDDYVKYNGFALHFNFNLIGKIVEIFAVPLEYLRKHRNLREIDMGIWDTRSHLYSNEFITFDMFGTCSPVSKMINGGYNNYKGQIYYFTKDGRIYPNSTAQTCTLSAEYEREVQLYSYANVKNSFSANNIIKLPTMFAGEKGQKEVDDLTANIKSSHGAGNAGSSIVVPVQIGTSGDAKEFKMVESLNPTNVDTLFVNQNESSERNILKTFMMPEILLGVSSQGMFNQAAFNDAFDYKNADTEQDRKIIEREFMAIIKDSVFPVSTLEIVPLKMRTATNQPATP